MTKRIMLLCASLASVIVLLGLFLVVTHLTKTRYPATPLCLYKCVPGPIEPISPASICSYRCVATSVPPVPPPDSPIADPAPVTALPDWLLLGGWVLPTLVALFLGLRHALVRRAFNWITSGLLLALLLEISLLTYIFSPLSQRRFIQEQALPLLLGGAITMVLVPVICLIYARTLEPQK